MLNYQESDEIRMLREVLRKFLDKEVTHEDTRRWDEENMFSRELWNKLKTLGITGSTISEEYGGTGVDIVATMVAIEELSRVSLAISMPYIMCTCYAGMNVMHGATEEQKQRWLPKIAAGDLIFAYGWTEPDVGADLASVKTTAVRDGDDVIVNGAKRFCSGAGISDYIFTLVNTDKEGKRYNNLSIVMVPPTAPGVTIEVIETMGTHGAPTTDVTFDNVRVPYADVLGGDEGWNNGWAHITGAGLDVEKLEVAAMALGLAAGAMEMAWQYSQERTQFNKRICEYQSIRHKLAEMQTKMHASRLMLYQAADLVSKGIRAGVETSMAKMFVTEMAKEVALEAQTVMGAYGYVKEFPVERIVRDVIVMSIFGGSTAIQKNNISNWMGLPRS